MNDRKKALDAALSQIDKQFGKGSAMTFGQKAAVEIETIPTGSLALDIALGVGGYPRGRIVEIYGPESSGKTTLTLHAIAEAQKKGLTCAFVDAEHAFDPIYAQNLGINLDELIISQPDHGEAALEISDTFGTWDFRNKIFNLILKNVVKNKAIEIKNPEAIVNLVYINDLLRKIENFIFSDIKFDSFYSIYSINLINLQKLIVSLYNREITETNDYFQYEKRLEVTNSTYGLNTIRDIQDVIFDEEYLEFLKNE